MCAGLVEPWAMRAIQRHVRPGGTAYDLGAHVGYTALVLGQAVARSGQVHAFELHPTTAGLLERTVDANRDLCIHVHRVGLGRSSYEIDLQLGPTLMTSLGQSGQGGARCKVEALDDYVTTHGLRPPHFMKVDIEGAEVECLHGARDLLRTQHPVLLIEFHSRALLREGLDVLRGLGYRRFTCKDPGRLEGQGPFHDSVLCSP
jgi:FkbM family methyltransferase